MMYEKKAGTANYTGVKPMQTIPFSKKDEEWKKQNVDHIIAASVYKTNSSPTSMNRGSASNMQLWYNTYNNRINEADFNYVTNPLNVAKDSPYANTPARLRAYNIIRPTIDLLIGEYSKRLFKFNVLNLDGEGVMNSFLETKYETFKQNTTKRLVDKIKEVQGENFKPEELPDPKTLIQDLNSNYKDLIAIKGQKALKQIEFEHKLKEKYKDCFKDWLIGGEVATIKQVRRSDIYYERLSPMWADHDKSPQVKNFEDGSYSSFKFRVTVADLVDMFYEDLTEENLRKLEQDENSFRKAIYVNLTSINANDTMLDKLNKVDLYYVTWKGRKKIGFLKYNDPFTGEPLTAEVDEDYKVDKAAGEEIEWEWVNEQWEGWRINDELYLNVQPVAVQRNQLNNFSSCKSPINGRRFSDTESENVSIVGLGMSYQIMYIIMHYRIEETIARSKGKIFVYDKNTISDDQDEQDKTFYYAFTLNMMGLNRDGDGVDRTWTQYQTLDLSLYNDIKQLIDIANFYKNSWEELLGISRQRKGAVNSSDGLGTTQEAVFRSSIISDIIFSTFDEWVESELQGLLDLSKFAWIDGKKGYFQNDDGRMELFQVDPEDHANAEYGVFVDSTGRTTEKMQILQQQINAIAQRKDIKLSTIADLIFTESYAELKAKLKQAEAIEAEVIARQAENEQERAIQLEQIKKDYLAYENILDIERQERDWDRKDNNEIIKGEIAGRVAGATAPIDIDVVGLQAESNKRIGAMEKSSLEKLKIQSNEKIAKMKDETEQKKIKAMLKNKVVGEK